MQNLQKRNVGLCLLVMLLDCRTNKGSTAELSYEKELVSGSGGIKLMCSSAGEVQEAQRSFLCDTRMLCCCTSLLQKRACQLRAGKTGVLEKEAMQKGTGAEGERLEGHKGRAGIRGQRGTGVEVEGRRQ